MNKPILCLDFDGVIHSYTSGWQGADVVADPPVDGAIAFIADAVEHFDVHIFSSRSNQEHGIDAMQLWLIRAFEEYYEEIPVDFIMFVTSTLKWPTEKPPAMVTIDDRALTFSGTWPDFEDLKNFKPWNKK
jgi:hypothetical protein